MLHACIGVSVYWCLGASVYWCIGVSVYRCIGVAVYRRIAVVLYRCVGYWYIGVSVYPCCSAYRCVGVSVKSKNLCYKQNKPNSWKIGFWYRLGALWAPSWRQDTAKATPGPEFNKKYSIFRCPVGSKMGKNLEKTIYKNRYDFRTDIRTTFFSFLGRFWYQKLSKMRGLGITFSTLLRIGEKCDFEQHS